MKQQFKDVIEENNLLQAGDPVLMAVSGGIDSMVMAHLFLAQGYHLGVAHCNFGLRGAESDADQELVSKFAADHHLAFHSIRFDTEAYAQAKGISIQMAARELRYSWFQELLVQHHYARVAVAHHADDAIETFFINLLRGTGLQGLAGIKARQGTVIRPLLFASRKEIAAYAAQESINYRDDSSNASHKYARNKLRHVVLPAMESINPMFRQRMAANMQYLHQAQSFVTAQLNQVAGAITHTSDGALHISIDGLKKQAQPAFCLFHLLEPYGFRNRTITDICNSLDAPSGRQFASHTHQLVKDRFELIVAPLPEQEPNTSQHLLHESDTTVDTPISLSLHHFARTSTFTVQRCPQVAQLDYDRLKFPLVMRRWKPGDMFVPLGMDGYKKLSDFFIDQKLSLLEKEQQWILFSDEQVVWVLGRRIDNRFKVTEQTKTILEVSLI